MTEEQEKSLIYNLTFEKVKEIHKNDTPIEALDNLHRLALAPNYVKPKSIQEKIRRLLRNKVEQALLKAQKQEKAWKIVNEKNVDVSLLNHCEYYTEYNVEIEGHNDKLKIYQGWWHRNKLAKEEFDLLKEMLE